MADPVLWQFKYSHYNEKARWALDFKRIPHRRRSLLPGLHIPPILWMTGSRYSLLRVRWRQDLPRCRPLPSSEPRPRCRTTS